MRLPRGHTLVAAMLALQVFGVGAGLILHAGHGAAAASAKAPTPPPPTPTRTATLATPTPTPSPTVPVAPLTARIAPDVLVQTTAPMSPTQVRALLAATSATAALLVDAGRVHLGGGTTTALGVDPSTFRAWTPAGTAESTPLWQNVAGGEVAVAHAVAKALNVPLGGTTTVGAVLPVPERVGAYATTGLPGIGLVVDAADEAPLGLTHATALLLTAAGRDPVVTAALATKALTAGRVAGTATATRVPALNGHLEWVAPAYGPITSPYGERPDPTQPGRTAFHAGIDIGAPLGAPIYAAADGVVQYAGPASGFGQEVVLTHAGGVSTVYGHMETILVTSGPVRAGQPIALVGAEGDATGPHLHFEVHVGDATVDPLTWLAAHGVRVER